MNVTDKLELKLIIAYDRDKNEYSVVAHNQTPEEAQNYLEQWARHLRPECSFIVLALAKRHQTEEAQRCRACRETVARSADVPENAKFTRRHE